jgi:hypothetical protein
MKKYTALCTILLSVVAVAVFISPPPTCIAQDNHVDTPHSLAPPWVTNLLSQVIDRGYPEYQQFIDVDGDGNIDYCRIVGDKPNQFLSCQMGTAPGYLSKEPYGFNSDKGIDIGQGLRGILPGTQTSGPRFCRYLNIQAKAEHSPDPIHPAQNVLSLRCIYGDPPLSNGKQRKFYADDSAPCANGFNTQALLKEDGLYSDPYLYCENKTTGAWNATRTDETGITWTISSVQSYDRIAHNTLVDTLIRQMTYLPDPKTDWHARPRERLQLGLRLTLNLTLMEPQPSMSLATALPSYL